MASNKVRSIRLFVILGILISILVACGGGPASNLSTLPPTVWSKTPFTDTPSAAPTLARSSTPSPTQDFFQ